jgi:hypothetical protein
MKELILDLSDLLLDEPEAQDQCIDRLIGSLEKRNGIKKIEVKKNRQSTPQLHVHFDEEHISEDHIRHIAMQTGKKLDETFGHLWIKIQEVRDNHHTRAVTTLLKNFKGVMNVLIVPTGWIFLEFNTYITQESVLKELIQKMDLVI